MIKKLISFLVFSFVFSFLLIGIFNVYNLSGFFDKPILEDTKLENNGCLVLSYHRILSSNKMLKFLGTIAGNKQLTTYNINKDNFEKQILYMKEKGVSFITPEQFSLYLEGKKPLPSEKCVLITFDDIDETVYLNAFPILKKYNIPATIFVITGQTGKIYKGIKLASWEQIKEMKQSGVITVGIHTNNMHFKESDGQPVFLNKDNLEKFKKDSELSIKIFEKQFRETPKYFAYPYGYGNSNTDKVLKDLGYELLFTLKPKVVTETSSKYFIGRFLLTKETFQHLKNWF